MLAAYLVSCVWLNIIRNACGDSQLLSIVNGVFSALHAGETVPLYRYATVHTTARLNASNWLVHRRSSSLY